MSGPKARYSIRTHVSTSLDYTLGMEDRHDDDSVQDWIDRARRAHDLVGRVDLEKVSAHDEDEVNKLDKVTNALDDLSQGQNVEYVPGVDEDEVPTLDEGQLRRSELMELLHAEGYADRVGRVFMPNAEDPIRPLDLIPHQEGLPDFDVCIAPEHTPAEGAHGIFVSERGVFAALIPEPATRHKWRILRSRPFDDQREMLETVRRFTAKPSE